MDAKVKAWNSPETHRKKRNTEKNRKTEITSTRTLGSQTINNQFQRGSLQDAVQGFQSILLLLYDHTESINVE
jgi:hypothetical protein